MSKRIERQFVCCQCLRNPGLIAGVAFARVSKECSFCHTTVKAGSIAPITNVAQAILERLSEDYGNPADYLPFESAEGGYQGATYTTRELLEEHAELDIATNVEVQVLQALTNAVPNDVWCSKHTYHYTHSEILHYSWKGFCDVVKRRRRFFFHDIDPLGEHEAIAGVMTPDYLLKTIAELVKEEGMLVESQPPLAVFRARAQTSGTPLTTALDLGPPTGEQAVCANRMNPPGIPVFYAAGDAVTAVEEIADNIGAYVVGRFETRRSVIVLDLAQDIRVPGYYEADTDTRGQLKFLRDFAAALAEPVERSDRNHVDYVPTQVVSEYFRTVVRFGGKPVDGIKWTSTRNPGGTCYALFASQNALVLSEAEGCALALAAGEPGDDDSRWLELVSRSQAHFEGRGQMQWAAPLACGAARGLPE